VSDLALQAAQRLRGNESNGVFIEQPLHEFYLGNGNVARLFPKPLIQRN
jgi:hypothetical protein